MDISVVIPAFNEQSLISETVSLIHKWMPESYKFEVIVVDHGSTDLTAQLAKDAGALVVDGSKEPTIAALRNAGVKRSSGELLFFIDADISFTEEWSKQIPAVIASLRDKPQQIAGSIPQVPENTSTLIKHWYAPKILDPHPQYLGSGHLLINRVLFDELNGFDASMETSEDLNLCQRAKSLGASINASPNLRVVHNGAPLSLPKFIKRESWHGRGDLTNLSSFLSSKVALLSGIFLLLHLLLVLSIMLGWAGNTVLIMLCIGLCLFASVIKFRQMGIASVLINALTFYFYFAGRSLAILSVIVGRQSTKRSRN